MKRWQLAALALVIPALLAAQPKKRKAGAHKRRERPALHVPPAPTNDEADHGPRGITSGDVLLAQGRFRQAAQVFSQEVQKNPSAVASWVGWGTAQAKIGRCADALDKLWPFAYTRPFKPEVALLAGRCSARLGYVDDAVYFDSLAVDRAPTNVQARSALALDLDRADDPVGSQIILEQLALMESDRDASWFAEAAIALRHGDLETLDVVNAMWAHEGRADEEFLRLRAISWMDLGDPKAALDVMTSVHKVRRGNGARILIVESLRRMSYAEEALDRYDRVAIAKLQGMDAEMIRARVMVDLGRLKEAKELMAAWADVADEEVAASTWYIARAEHNQAAMVAAADVWEGVRTSPIRTLEQLVPLGE